MRELPTDDFAHILAHTGDLWEDLRGARVFLTGGTSFLGRWLVESLLHANAHYGLGATVTLLTRDPAAFPAHAPDLAHAPALSLLAGDLETFPCPAPCTHIVHAARVGDDDPVRYLDRNLAGTERVLEFARASGAGRVLYVSSGAVYGPQPPELSHLFEDYPGAPDPLVAASSNGMMKRACEFACAQSARRHGFSLGLARCFSFVGPGLPLNIQLAAGNFLRDALRDGPIRVEGDGTPYRSYLYAADLAIWLWTIFLRGASGRAYNVGSEAALSIAELARRVAARRTPPPEVIVARLPEPGQAAARYVPSTARARQELGLRETVALDEALDRTLRWYEAQPELLGAKREA